MSIVKTLGGDRLGTGKKMRVGMHGWGRTSFNRGFIWRSTMAAGTVVPFLVDPALPGATYDIELDCDVKTQPTVGPLFGSYKLELDLFKGDLRLYNGLLHNNTLNIGRNISQVKFPQITFKATRNAGYTNDTKPYEDINAGKPALQSFPLTELDHVRNYILQNTSTAPVSLNTLNIAPFKYLYEQPNGIPNMLSSQEGLAIKTYIEMTQQRYKNNHKKHRRKFGNSTQITVYL